MWSIADAKAHLSELLAKARSGAARGIGAQEPCSAISLDRSRHVSDADHDGRWLVELSSKTGCDIPVVPRNDDPVSHPTRAKTTCVSP